MENKLAIIKNPFDKSQKEIVYQDFVGQTVFDIVKDYIPIDLAVIAIINGGIVKEEDWETTRLSYGDELIIAPIIEGGGGDGKNILQIVALVALVAVAPAIAGGAFGGVGFSAEFYALGTGLIMLAGGLLITTLFAAPQPKLPSFEDQDISQSFSWNPSTKQAQGTPIPVIYGRTKVYGNIIAAHTDVTEDNTSQILNMLIGLGEGPIGGIVNTDPSSVLEGEITLNGQPLSNYSDVIVEERKGYMTQDVVSFFRSTATEVTPNRKVSSESSETYTTTDSDYDDLEVILSFPQGLYYANDQGGISDHTVGIKIELAISGSGDYQTLVDKNIKDNRQGTLRRTYKASNNYEGGASIEIINGNAYDIKVTKTTEDNDGARYGDKLILNAVTSIIDDPFIYPKLALCGIKALASDQISGSIDFSAIVDGKYVRVWDGEWNWEVSSNPAWVCWDILTKPVLVGDNPDDFSVARYDGLDPSRLDLDSFYEWAQFCDQLVPISEDNPSDLETNLRFDGTFDQESSMWLDALKVCEVGRAALVWSGRGVKIVVDKIAEATQLFSAGNVIKNTYKQTFLPQAERASEIEANFLDQDQDYTKTTVVLFNPNIENATKRINVDAFGVTRGTQVWREMNFRLGLNQLLQDTITFESDIEAIACEIGDVIKFSSPTKKDVSSGRILEVSRDGLKLTLDAVPLLENTSADIYEIIVRLNDDTIEKKIVIDVEDNVVTVESGFTGIVEQDDVYSFGVIDNVIKKYRILSINRTSENQAKIDAIEYSDDFYGEQLPIVQQDVYTPATMSGLYVQNLTATEEASINSWGVIDRRIVLNWQVPSSIAYQRAEVWYKINDPEITWWTKAGETSSDTFTLPGVEEYTDYIIRVISVSNTEIRSAPELSPTITITTGGKNDFAEELITLTISGLQVEGGSTTQWSGKDVRIEWDPIPVPEDPSVMPPYDPSIPLNEVFSLPENWLKDYQVVVKDSNGVILRTEYVSAPVNNRYIYTLEKNLDDGGGTSNRNLTFEVKVRDKYYRLGQTPAAISVSNPAPNTVTGITNTATSRGIRSKFNRMNSDNDFTGTKIFMSQSSPVSTADDTDLVGNTTDDNFFYAVPALGTWYIKHVAHDEFFNDAAGASGLNVSGEDSVVVTDLSEVSTDYPVSTVEFNDNDPSATTWAAYWTSGTVTFGGISYDIPAGETEKKYVYWIEGSSEFLATDDPDTVLSNDIWIMAINDQGIVTVPFATKIVSAGILQVGSITAESAIIADAAITSAKIGYLEVEESNIADGAVTVQNTSSTDGEVDISNNTCAYAKYELQSVGHEATGQTINILMQCVLFIDSDSDPCTCTLTLYRGATLLQTWTQDLAGGFPGPEVTFNATYIDAPSAGSYTYYLYGCSDVNADQGATAKRRILSTTEIKK